MRMDEKDLGRVPSEPGSRERSPSPGSPPNGFDPSRGWTAWSAKAAAKLSPEARQALIAHTGIWASSQWSDSPRWDQGGKELLAHGLIQWRSGISSSTAVTEKGRKVRAYLKASP